LLAGVQDGSATVAVKGDQAGAGYQASPLCAQGQTPAANGCVDVTLLGTDGQPVQNGAAPAFVRFDGIAGHFSTYAVALVTRVADSAPPSVTINLTAPNGGTPDGHSGWFFSGPVAGAVSADDSASGGSDIKSIDCGSLALTTSGLGTPTATGKFSIAADGLTHIACTATDAANNTSAPVSRDVMLDTHAPTVSANAVSDVCSLSGSNGWCPGTQTAGFSANDATSGVTSPCTAAAGSSCVFTQSTSKQGAAITIPSGSACDVAGNCASGIDAGPYKIDSSPPTLAPTIAPTPVVLHGSATASPNATDTTSGVASQSCDPVDTGTAGTHTLTCTATDNAGNAASASVSYFVGYKILGFFSPVPNSKWKQGQTVPIKVAVGDANGTRISDSEAQGLLSPSCRVMFVATGAQSLSACAKYDTTEHQFIYNWKIGQKTGNVTISIQISYPGTTAKTTLSEPIVVTS